MAVSSSVGGADDNDEESESEGAMLEGGRGGCEGQRFKVGEAAYE